MKERNKQIAVEEYRYDICFHAAGHAAMAYWIGERLDETVITIEGEICSSILPTSDETEHDLMVLLAGLAMEFMFMNFVPKAAWVWSGGLEDGRASCNTRRIRRLVKRLRAGKHDRRYQRQVQDRVVEILRQRPMSRAVDAIAEILATEGRISGQQMKDIFTTLRVPDRFGGVRI